MSYSAPSYSSVPYNLSASTSTSPAPDFIQSDIARSELATQMAIQGSIYTPEGAKRYVQENPVLRGQARKTVLRKGGGAVWEDQTLIDWDPGEPTRLYSREEHYKADLEYFAAHFRLFCGNLDPALPDETFRETFAKWPSLVRTHLVRDKMTNRVKYGFAAYRDPEDFLAAWRTLNGEFVLGVSRADTKANRSFHDVSGKYVGTRPIKLSKATAAVATVQIGDRKAREFDKKRAHKTGTVPFSRAKLAEAEGGGLHSTGVERSRKSYIRR
ncbi:hypothetical protein P7C70_g1363, partial [Phenoliferia sp. Uapishka_3]